jgi:ketosteroid isomerase-like protein
MFGIGQNKIMKRIYPQLPLIMLKKYLIFLALSVYAPCTNAQTPFHEIVKAERNFEKSCLEKGIRQGFLANLDSTAVAFTKKGIENAYQFWNSLPEFQGIYSWAPSFAEVSIAGDWGYTTGAVEYRDSLISDPPSAYNQYTTVWHKTPEGEWKYLADIGNKHYPVKIDSIAAEIRIKKVPVKNLSEQTMLTVDKAYNSQLGTDPLKTIKKYFSSAFVLNITGHAAITKNDSLYTILGPIARDFKYTPKEVKLSSSGDLAVVYGKLIYKNTVDSYIRIWRHELTGWKIALEVARL